MKKNLLSLLFICVASSIGFSQNLQVETILDLNASGGVTFGPDGNVYLSDFGPSLGTPSSNTKVYKVEYGTWEVNEFATGFSGASGAAFDSQGNFYQSNPSGGRVSKRSTNGTLNLNWATNGISGPIGITKDKEDNLYVCNCGNNTIRKITPAGVSTLHASSPMFNCPNGITIDAEENLYACNFSDGRVLKISPDGNVSLFATYPTVGGVGNGHITFSNGFLYVALIGVGQIHKLTLSGDSQLIAGQFQGFSNLDGPALDATFSKPNGIAASYTGDTLWVNCSVPTWPSNNLALHPGLVRMVTGVCSLADVDCPLLTKTKEVLSLTENQQAQLSPLSPNPVSTSVTINFDILDSRQQVELKIRNAAQQEVALLFTGKKGIGNHSYRFDSSELAPGIYFVFLESEDYRLVRKMMVVSN